MHLSFTKIMRFTSTLGVMTIASASLGQGALAAEMAKPNTQMQAVLDELTKLGPKPLETLTAVEARKQPSPADAVKALLKKQGKSLAPEAVAKVEDKAITGPGGNIPIRIYTPKGEGPFPVIVYYHGGGWVIADLDTYDASPRALVNATNAVVVSAHYRQWVLEHAKELKGYPKRIALVGESAGGNLAASVSVLAREHKMQMPVYQVLVYPIADDNLETASYIENAKAKPLSRAAMQWFFKQYLNTPADGSNHLISLVSEKNLANLPPTTVITAQIDPLRSEGKAYADLLQKTGIDVRYKNYEGVTHEFFGMGAVVDKAKEAQQFAAEGLKKAFVESK